jgi:hypothetical protein
LNSARQDKIKDALPIALQQIDAALANSDGLHGGKRNSRADPAEA